MDRADHFSLELEQVAEVREHRGDPRANVAAVDDGRVAARHAGDSGDRVQRAVWQYANDDAEVAGPRRAVPRLLCVCRKAVQADGDERHDHQSGGVFTCML